MTEQTTKIYIRVSTEDQNAQNQLQDCLSINQYGDYDIIEDKQSAWKDNLEREGFTKLNNLIKQGKVKHLICWDFDRLYRNRTKFKEFLLLLKAFNVKLHSYRQNWFEDFNKIPSPWNEIVGDLIINIYGHIAEEESKKKSERVKLAVRKKSGEPTLSYKGNRWGRKALSTQKKNMIKDLHIQHKSIREIARELNISIGVVHKTIKSFIEEKVEQ